MDSKSDYDYEEVREPRYLPGDIIRHTSGELFVAVEGGACVPMEGYRNFSHVASAAPEKIDSIMMDASATYEEDMHMNDIISEEIEFAKKTGVIFAPAESREDAHRKYMMSPKGIKIVNSVKR